MNNQLREAACQRENYEVKKGDRLVHDIEYSFVRLIEKYSWARELEFLHKLEKLRLELNARYDFNKEEVFKKIDISHSRFIGFNE